MSLVCFPQGRRTLKDEDIIRLYKEGLSQHDIITNYKVSLSRARNVLRSAGFDTKSYRKIDPAVKEILLAIFNSGAPYHAIESVCDISADVIRQYVIDQNCQGRSRKARAEQTGKKQPKIIFKNRNGFAQQYSAGNTFCFICLQMEIPLKTQVSLFWEIWNKQFIDADIEIHRASLTKLIREDAAAGLSDSAIARKRIMSKSVVRKMLAR